ncbi:MAG: hypothetical protein U0670_16805 [Anaerolineae bacterium]
MFEKGDCDLAEINPLVLTPDNRVHALDAKVTLEDNAEYKHPEWEAFKGVTELDGRDGWPPKEACSTSASTVPSALSPTVRAWR